MQEAILSKEYVSTKERTAFYFGAMFRDMSYAIMAFLTYFYIDILGLTGGLLSAVLILSRLWDGVNDPLIGVYFDKSVTDNGKAKPFFRITSIPVAILIVLIFFAPTFSHNANINGWLRALYALLTYIIFEGLHTLNGTSFMSLYNSITPNAQEKVKVISVSRLFSNIGTGIVGGGIPILLSRFANDDIQAKTYIYFFTAVAVGICFIIYNKLMYTYVNERVLVVPEKQQNVKDMFRSFFKNKLLMLMIISNTIAGLINPGTTGLWFYTYNMGNAALMTYVGLLGLPFIIGGTLLVPKLNKRIEKATMVIWLSVFQVLINVIFIIIGYQSVVVVVLIGALNLLPMTMKNALYWSMVSDSIDYLEWKTGDRNDGMVFAIEGFLGKCVGSIGALSTVIIVAVIKYVPNAPAQSEYTMKGLFYLPLIIGIASAALSTIPYFFYKFDRKEHQKALLEIKSRKEEEPIQDII